MPRRIIDLKVGDKIIFGAYDEDKGIPHRIKWIKATNDNIFITERVECCYPFDRPEPNNPRIIRANSGNNRYSVSNIDQFLNSRKRAWNNPTHSHDAPPDEARRNGFLAFFRRWEIEKIQRKKLKTELSDCDKEELGKNYEIISRRIFLPSRSDLVKTGDEKVWEYFQTACPETTDLEGDRRYYWTRSPSPKSEDRVWYVAPYGGVDVCQTHHSIMGVRPALKLKSDTIVIDELDDQGYYEVIQYDKENEILEEDLYSILNPKI